jgi:hypothetical protein
MNKPEDEQEHEDEDDLTHTIMKPKAETIPTTAHVEIAYILDRSGSMQPMQEPAVAAFNDFVRSQLEVPGEARLTLVQFDDRYEVPIAALRVQDVPQLTAATYTPRGSTALLDAIGRTIKDFDIRLQKLPAAHQPAKVILAIFTDGEENASREYTAKHISDLIHLYRDTKGWEFLFLAANQDAIASASAMHMDAHLSGNAVYSPAGIKATGGALARKVRVSRLKASGQMDAAAVADDAKSLDQILREEEKK